MGTSTSSLITVDLSETTAEDCAVHSSSMDDHPKSSKKNRMIPSLHENMMQEHHKRDPKEFYEEIQLLGEGSMGSVYECRKRDSVVGGSARPEFVKKHHHECSCYFPVVLSRILLSRLYCYTTTPKFVETNIGKSDRHHHHHHDDHPPPPRVRLLGCGGDDKDNDITASITLNGSSRGGSPPSKCASSKEELRSLSEKTSSSLCSTGKDVHYALKSIKLSHCHSKGHQRELENEVSILKSLDHPNIVKAIETFQYNHQLYLVLEMCTGGDLYTRDPYTEQQSVRIVQSVLSAVSYLHAKGIIHRDLKFENIVFANSTPESEVKIIDFGLSQKFAAHEHLTDKCGTIYTMAPEVLKGDYDSKADLWSIGVIAFMLLSSSTPFFGVTRKVTVQRILMGRYNFSSRRWRYVSHDAKRFVKKLLQYQPDDRPTAEQALECCYWIHQQQGGFDLNDDGKSTMLRRLSDAKRAIRMFTDYGKLKKLALMVIAYRSTSEEIGSLRNVFDKFDEHHDGEIDLAEFKALLLMMQKTDDDDDSGGGSSSRPYTEDDIETMFSGMDVEGTGYVHYSEFIAATLEANGAIDEERVAEAFDRIDIDDTGYITVSDLKSFLGDDIPTEYIDEIIDEADLNHDHQISYQEFLNLWE